MALPLPRFTVLDAEAPEFTPSGYMAPEPFAVDGTADITIDGLQIDEEVEEVEEVRYATADKKQVQSD